MHPRTSKWVRKLPSGSNDGGPIEHLREVIIDDSLGICEELDRRMDFLIRTYHDEWAEAVSNPNMRKKFKQFVNTGRRIPKEDMIEYVEVRGQKHPAFWSKDGQPQTNWRIPDDVNAIFALSKKSWIDVGSVSDFPANEGSPVLYSDTQLAVFNDVKRGKWYCTQNMCPHKQAFVLSQGIIGDKSGVPEV